MKSYGMLLTAAALLGAGLATAGTASAAEPGWYVGADIGRSELKPDSGSSTSDTAFAVRGGYRVGPYFAIEAAYADLGDYEYTTECSAGIACIPEYFPVRTKLSGDRAELAVLGILPINEQFEAYARLGYARTSIDSSVRAGLGGEIKSSDSSSDPVYGVGLRFNFDPSWALRAEYDRVSDINDASADLDTAWLGVEYRFGG